MGRQSASIREQRIHEVLDVVTRQGSTTAEALAERLGVSLMTVYRDVSALESSGLIQRAHGRISSTPFSMAESSSLMRIGRGSQTKARLAARALELLSPGQTVAIDDSTTCLGLFPGIADLAPLTIVTNARFIADAVLEHPSLELVQIGGTYVRWADAFNGPLAEAEVARLSVDVCLMSTTAIVSGRCCHPDADMSSFKGALMRAAQRRILLVDRTKFTRNALHAFFDLDDVDVAVTEEALGEDALARLREHVGTVVTV
ncbi:MAG: DeoR/GlpR family DNA-binding transcription regulator [Actinomyces sp.]|jgi:DeoR/GlpR family transcriptional regulator of sugar metabolism|nr:DeoR/GlpR family DNA-binding transcription regulator [Actinomyces sp.]MCI1662652.1 DeoR/GlpR family DNA-binding transcription regulator [Actinomyces sp.]